MSKKLSSILSQKHAEMTLSKEQYSVTTLLKRFFFCFISCFLFDFVVRTNERRESETAKNALVSENTTQQKISQRNTAKCNTIKYRQDLPPKIKIKIC